MSISNIPPEPIKPYTPLSDKTEKLTKLDKLLQYVVEIPESSIFYDSDLILVSDKALEFDPLPLNVIVESEFKEMVLIYHKIKNDKDPVIHVVDKTIKTEKGDVSFKDQIMDSIKQIMTRPIGRALLWSLTKYKPVFHKIKIKSIPGIDNHCDLPEDSEGREIINEKKTRIEVKIGEKCYYKLEHQPTGIVTPREKNPQFINLAHELFHCLRDQFSDHGQERLGEESLIEQLFIDKKFDNLEEFTTITGWYHDPTNFFRKLSRNTELEDVPTDPTTEEMEDFQRIYTALNERDFTAQFTSNENIFYPRANHQSRSKFRPKTDEDHAFEQRLIKEIQHERRRSDFSTLWNLAEAKIREIQYFKQIQDSKERGISDVQKQHIKKLLIDLKSDLKSLEAFKIKPDILSTEIKKSIKENLTFLLNYEDSELKDLAKDLIKKLSL